ncbi:unnamed protein product [Colias eurytheme]|nr:unnamed protein product [Colias eurytheme]
MFTVSVKSKRKRLQLASANANAGGVVNAQLAALCPPPSPLAASRESLFFGANSYRLDNGLADHDWRKALQASASAICVPYNNRPFSHARPHKDEKHGKHLALLTLHFTADSTPASNGTLCNH